MRQASTLVSRTLGEVAKWVAPGVTTRHLDNIAREFMPRQWRQARMSRLRRLSRHTLHRSQRDSSPRISLRLRTPRRRYNRHRHRGRDSTDTTATCATLSPRRDRPGKCSHSAKSPRNLSTKGIEAAQEGKRIGDIANTIQTYCERHGYSVVREMCGHGIGRKMHEDPEVPNYGRRG